MSRRRLRVFAVALACLLPSLGAGVASAGEPKVIASPSEEVEATCARLRGRLAASALAKLEAGAVALAPKILTRSPAQARKAANAWVKATWPEAMGMSDVLVLLMMLATEDAREDMKTMLSALAAIEAAKEADARSIAAVEAELATRGRTKIAKVQRKPKRPLPKPTKSPVLALEYWPAPELPELAPLAPMTVAELEAALTDLRDRHEALSEMGAMQSARMQIYLDRMQQAMTMMSKLAKKLNDTNQSIIDNLK